MFIAFIEALRRAGVPASLKEHLLLLEALDAGSAVAAQALDTARAISFCLVFGYCMWSPVFLWFSTQLPRRLWKRFHI